MKNIKGKRIGIIGAVKSGVGAAKLAKRFGAIPFVTDMNDAQKISDYLKQLDEHGIAYETGGHTPRIYESDLVVVSPGVPSNAPIVEELNRRSIPVISEIEFASYFCEGSILAVTGTNGKTTTTALLHHVISESGRTCYAAGNIGFAFSEIAADVPADGFVALEVSSFQLDTIDRFAPKIAMILNITPDHLNRYNNNFEEYIQSKFRITKNQNSNSLLILNADNEILEKYPIKTNAVTQWFSMETFGKCSIVKNGKSLEYIQNGDVAYSVNTEILQIKGDHNYQNTAAVIIAAKFIGIENEKISAALATFKAVEHRLEPAGIINGVEFINDSKATNIDSVKVALKSFSTPLILILGGQDKGNDYSLILPLMRHVKKIYAIGSSRDKIFNFFNGKIFVERKTDMNACVQSALEDSIPGDTVLLSPACASFDMFENYEHRGRVFKDIVKGYLV